MCDDSNGSGNGNILRNIHPGWSTIDHTADQHLSHSDQVSFVSNSSDHFTSVAFHPYHGMLSSQNNPSLRTDTTTPSLTLASKVSPESRKKENLHKKTEHGIVLESGFSFGKRSISFEPTYSGCLDEDSDGDKTIEEIYGTEMKDVIAYRPIRSPAAKHRVLSNRIGKVGFIGQNLSPGHILGPLSEHRPKSVKLDITEYVIDENSPVQIDIKWSKPENVDIFKSLTYNIQMKLKSANDNWTPIACVKFPVFRIYHTDDKLLLSKVHLSRKPYDLTYVLRCQTQGDIYHEGVTHILVGDWSTDITLTFCGYQNEHKIVESQSL